MTPTPIRTVCFDFDGTLAYMSPSHWALYAEAAHAAGLDVSEAALAAEATDRAWAPWMTPLGPVHLDASASQAAFRQLRADLAADRIRAAGATDEPALREAGRRAALLEEEAARYVLFADTLPAMERLAGAGVNSIIVSNHIWTLMEIIAELGIGDRFVSVISSARCGYRKPHPEIFNAALRLTGIPASETLMVGDSLSADVRGAEAAGMRAVLIQRDASSQRPEGVHAVRSLIAVPLLWPPVEAEA